MTPHRLSPAVLAAVLAALLVPPPAAGLTPGEEATILLFRKAAAGVVNITSTQQEPGFAWHPVPEKGTGSGFVLDDHGHVVTSCGAVGDGQSLEVTTRDGRRWPARLVGADPATDIAVVEIRAPKKVLAGLPPLLLGQARDLAVGQRVWRVSDPFGEGPQLAEGLLAAKGRTLRTRAGLKIRGVLQTDIPVHPGAEGAPLLDSSGRVIGMCSLAFADTRALAGIGFAVSAEVLQRIVPGLLADGYVLHAWLGAEFETLSPALARLTGLPVERGAVLTRLFPQGPALDAGLRAGMKTVHLGNRTHRVGGDVIVAVDGKDVASAAALEEMIDGRKPGTEVTLTLYRDGRRTTAKVRVEERPAAAP
ncbi:serine protease [Dissulfurirhabdus thermomarina]|uniref:Serine protease n=1 Tax=Dissulfurirhabdus thermomarina TaxID=1765737 RepID=A0A6N9TPL6_DISTH|nr:S1C family serine protease [Dissulfurirhabdus thermomarina]NDY41684.1 serine protease [Dissulfurirhabdus thermomarina]NMX22748.1 serine protease [Dissulfurirhabdus thermomarina]